MEISSSTLTNDIILIIISFLNMKDRLSLGLSCRRFNNLIGSKYDHNIYTTRNLITANNIVALISRLLKRFHNIDLTYSPIGRWGQIEGISQSFDLNVFNCDNNLTLNLSHNLWITDVSALSKVYKLDLSCCPGITDVSPLGNVHELSMENCLGITDVSTLGKVHKLHLTDCKEITDVSALGNVYELHLDECKRIINVSALGNVHILDLSGCSGITDVSALGNVHELFLINCPRITDVSALSNVPKLYTGF